MSLYIYQDGTKIGEVNDMQTAKIIVANLVASTPSKSVVVKENGNTISIEYKVAE